MILSKGITYMGRGFLWYQASEPMNKYSTEVPKKTPKSLLIILPNSNILKTQIMEMAISY